MRKSGSGRNTAYAMAAMATLAPLALLVAALAGCATGGADRVFANGRAIVIKEDGAQRHAGPLRCFIRAKMVPTATATTTRGAPLSEGRLRLLAGDPYARRAIILVAGIHDTYRYFDGWIDALGKGGDAVFGWDHDHRFMTMAQSAEVLAQDIRALGDHGATDIELIAHSIGGLVAKAAIDILSRAGAAPSFDRLDLQALGTPWGGFALVEYALLVPGSTAISKALGYPMAAELQPDSAFLAGLARPMPANGRMHIYVGDADHVALPFMSATRSRYASIEAYASMVTMIEGLGHGDYGRAPVFADVMKDGSQRTDRCAGDRAIAAQSRTAD